MRAFVVDTREGDAGVRAAVDQADVRDRFVLIADDTGERRAEMLGLRTGAVFGAAALRRVPLLPASAGCRSLRTHLEEFDELVFSSEHLLDAVVRACAGARALPRRRVIGATAPDGVGVPRVPREVIRSALGCGDELLIALASDPATTASASDFVRVCQILAIVGHRVTAVVPRGAGDLSRAKAVAASTGVDVRLLTAEAPMWALLPGLDAAVIDVAESSLAPIVPDRSRWWFTRCCVQAGVWAAVSRTLVEDVGEVAGTSVALAESRLPVHLARALDGALRSVQRAASPVGEAVAV